MSLDNKQSSVRYVSWTNTIKFPQKLGSAIIPSFMGAINEWQKKRPHDLLTLDMQGVQQPYSNGLVPIIAIVTKYRLNKFQIRVDLPNNQKISRMYLDTNWAHFLDPKTYKKSEAIHDKHLVTRQFLEYHQLGWIMKDFMDVVLRSVPKLPKDIFSALEWSVNEICDNVLNHSESPVGGFVQIVTYPKQGKISFSVADAGKSILKTLRDGIPTLENDIQAIGEAIKAGVTRNKELGQGNGLAGTLKITTMSSGSLEVLSGLGRFYTTIESSQNKDNRPNMYYPGTSVSGTIGLNAGFKIDQALNFTGSIPYQAVDMIDMVYEMEDKDCLLITMRTETTGFGTRSAGAQMRTKTLNLINAKPNYPIHIDWAGIPVISSSFADEFMGKLFLELGALRFSALIKNFGMEMLVLQLLDTAILQRLNQANDPKK